MNASREASEIGVNENDYLALKQRAFRVFPREVLLKAIIDLSHSALKAYLVMYDLSELAYYKTKRSVNILVSYSHLAKKINKSISTAGRALHQLKQKGYIKIYQSPGCNGHYTANRIFVGFPKHQIKNILDKTSPCSQPACAQPRDHIITRPVDNDAPKKIIQAPSQARLKDLVQHVQNKVAYHQKSGHGPFKANMKALNELRYPSKG